VNKKLIHGCILAFLFSLFTIHYNKTVAQTAIPDSTLRSFRLFEDDKLLELSLRFDLTKYFRTKPQSEYLKAKILIPLNATDTISKNIKLKTRGVFRNSYCFFPPIELNFKNTDFGYSDLNKISKLKLVPQCSSGKDNEDCLLREYLVYKLFNVLTDTSFRVRLLSVNYIDSERKRKPIKQYGIFIEPEEMLAERVNCIKIKTKTLTQENIIPLVMDRLAIFNYMIGNFDWSVQEQKNILIIKSVDFDPTRPGIAISYDFDWTGFVDPRYAVPVESSRIDNVRERVFLGICRTKAEYQKDLDLFLEKKDEFYRVINEFPYISLKSKKDLTGYLDGFFKQIIGNRDKILNDLLNTCRTY
jgi:hypothetical protein